MQITHRRIHIFMYRKAVVTILARNDVEEIKSSAKAMHIDAVIREMFNGEILHNPVVQVGHFHAWHAIVAAQI